MAKRGKIKLGCLYKISSLPDPILCRIISSIPIKDAVRTSILSTRWRYLFASMTSVQLDDRCLNHGSVESFMNFGDRLLVLSSEPSLECFRLVWVRAALGRGVKELDLLIDIREFMLPSILFACKSLVTLKLQLGFRMYVPRGACFPNLKKLQLTYMKLCDNDSVQRLFSSCLVLEDLVIHDCWLVKISELIICNASLKRLEFEMPVLDWDHTYSVMIDAPSLVYLKYVDYISEGYAGNMPCLEGADITILVNCHHSRRDYKRDAYKRAATDLLLIRNVRSLQFKIDHPETGLHLRIWLS